MIHTRFFIIGLVLAGLTSFGCGNEAVEAVTPEPPPMEEPTPEPPVMELDTFVRGADLSYVNEMEDCGAVYLDSSGADKDPYVLFAEAGARLVRVRLWHNPEWTDYSNEADVQQTIRRAKEAGMDVLLDFHYSDDWADPGKQVVPAAWKGVVNDVDLLGDSVYNYTYRVLRHLNTLNLLPELVQVGNEINAEILQDPEQSYDRINWTRNAALINRGIQAVRDAASAFNTEIGVMLHVAQPENALWWFQEATDSGISDYDWIGISYYPIWSDYSLFNVRTAVEELTTSYQKRLMVVETAYPFTLNNADAANNILGTDALVTGYPATPQGQLDYLKALEASIRAGGGEGLIYWEPAWVSTDCRTQWAQGSHWDNATLFDFNKQATKALEYYNRN